MNQSVGIATGQSKPQSLQIGFFGVEEPNLGVRKSMEDFLVLEEDVLGDGRFAIFVVMDGHGGSEVVKLVKSRFGDFYRSALRTQGSMKGAVKNAIASTANLIVSSGTKGSGTTFCGLFVDRQTKTCLAANIGDSRMIGGRKPAFITPEHKASNEAEARRIRQAGGTIINGRVGGTLMVTRSLGDVELASSGVIAEPEIFEFPAEKGLIAIASDGLWDQTTPQLFDQTVKKFVGRPLSELGSMLVDQAIANGSMDNISLILVVFG